MSLFANQKAEGSSLETLAICDKSRKATELEATKSKHICSKTNNSNNNNNDRSDNRLPNLAIACGCAEPTVGGAVKQIYP